MYSCFFLKKVQQKWQVHLFCFVFFNLLVSSKIIKTTTVLKPVSALIYASLSISFCHLQI